MAAKHERRSARMEMRVEGGGDGNTLVGYAALFNTEYLIGSEDWGFYESIDPAAFDRALREGQDAAGLLNHDPNLVLGRVSAGTMRLSTDAKGLRYEIDLPDSELGRNVREMVRRGDIYQSSFAFRTVKDEWKFEKGETDRRRLLDVDLFDASPVTYPANDGTEVALRCRDLARPARRGLLRARVALARRR